MENELLNINIFVSLLKIREMFLHIILMLGQHITQRLANISTEHAPYRILFLLSLTPASLNRKNIADQPAGLVRVS